MSGVQSKKVGLFSAISIVMSSQLGIGILMLGATIGKYGVLGIIGICIGGIFAMLLSMMFVWLFKNVSDGSLHKYSQDTFGDAMGFIVGWSYWIAGCIGNITFVITCANYILSLLGTSSPQVFFYCQVSIIILVAIINYLGPWVVGLIEVFSGIVRIVGLLSVPCLVFFFNKFSLKTFLSGPIDKNWVEILRNVVFLSMWGFLGLESITCSIKKISDPKKNIPLALLIGTSLVAIVYIFNVASFIVVLPQEVLNVTTTPYSDLVGKVVTSNKMYVLLVCMPVLISFSNLNVWTFSSSNFGESLAYDKFLPQLLKKNNRFGAPYVSITIPCLLYTVFTLLNTKVDLQQQILLLVNVSVIVYLLVYIFCALSLIKALTSNSSIKFSVTYFFIGLVCLIGAVYSIGSSDITTILYAIILVLTGLPYYFYTQIKKVTK